MKRAGHCAKTLLGIAAGMCILTAASPLLFVWAVAQGGGDIGSH